MFNSFVQFCQYTGIIFLCTGLGFRSYIFATLDRSIQDKELPSEQEIKYLDVYNCLNLILLLWLPITLVLSELNLITHTKNGIDIKSFIGSLINSTTLWLFLGLGVLHMTVIATPLSKKMLNFRKATGGDDE